jgi:hypothetical protein
MKVFVGELKSLIGSGKRAAKDRNSIQDTVVPTAKANPHRVTHKQPANTIREEAQPIGGHVIPFDDDFNEFDEF